MGLAANLIYSHKSWQKPVSGRFLSMPGTILLMPGRGSEVFSKKFD
jgi:hypothetical protein